MAVIRCLRPRRMRLPLGGGHNARHKVEKEELFRARPLTIDVESGVHLQHPVFYCSLPVDQLAFCKVLDIFHQLP
jgi:hypothetical protein